MSAEFFQRVFDSMTPRQELPATGHEGDLCKLVPDIAYVYLQGAWLPLDEAMNLVFEVQKDHK